MLSTLPAHRTYWLPRVSIELLYQYSPRAGILAIRRFAFALRRSEINRRSPVDDWQYLTRSGLSPLDGDCLSTSWEADVLCAQIHPFLGRTVRDYSLSDRVNTYSFGERDTCSKTNTGVQRVEVGSVKILSS